MSGKSRKDNDLTGLDRLIEETTVDAYGNDEQLWAFLQAFEDEVSLPASAAVCRDETALSPLEQRNAGMWCPVKS